MYVVQVYTRPDKSTRYYGPFETMGETDNWIDHIDDKYGKDVRFVHIINVRPAEDSILIT